MYIPLEELKEQLEEQNNTEALMDDDSWEQEEQIPDGTEELSLIHE